MVKIIENEGAIESQEEHESRLVEIVKQILPGAIILSPFSGEFGIFFKDQDEKKLAPIYIYPNRNYIRVINQKYFNKALIIAKKYEKIGEPEFTVKKDYSI